MSSHRFSRVLNGLRKDGQWRSHLLICLVFSLLFASFIMSLGRYWQYSLQPRLYLAAETQAKILAQSQAAILVEAIERNKPEQRAQKLFDAVQELLIVEDPAIGGRIVLGLDLQFDYDTLDEEPGKLDLREGDVKCATCFRAYIPLINHGGDLLGVADFAINNGYFLALSDEMKFKLYAESSLALGLIAAVWAAMLFMFHRLHAAKQTIEASDRAKTRFMANVTHELRTPLNAILGYTQLYKADSALMENYAQGIKTIDRSAEHLLLLINDILDFSRVDEAKLKLYPREVLLVSFLNTLVEMTDVRARLKSIAFIHRFPAQLPAAVLVDDKRLRQVLLNLLSNAVKFTEQGEVVFSVEKLAGCASDNVCLRFSVSDTGIGIAKNEIKNIFIPFQQLDNAITRAEGSGLGLTISKQLVKLMGSRLKVESVPGKGSRFWFDLQLPLLSGQEFKELAVVDNKVAKTSPELVLPATDTITALIEQARRHNVLAVREIIQELEKTKDYAVFLEKIQPYIQHYRFKQLAQWLEQVIESKS